MLQPQQCCLLPSTLFSLTLVYCLTRGCSYFFPPSSPCSFCPVPACLLKWQFPWLASSQSPSDNLQKPGGKRNP